MFILFGKDVSVKVSKVLAAVYAVLFLTGSLKAADIIKADNSDDLNLGSSWVGGVVPGVADVAVWNSSVTVANSTGLGTDLTIDGIAVADPGGAVTLGGSYTLTLDGGADLDFDLSAATRDLIFECPL